MKKIYFRDDFDFIFSILDKYGLDIGWPDFNWSVRFWTASKANAFTAGCTDGECTNCFPDEGRIHIVFDNHGLSFGDLFFELTMSLPSEYYNDRSKDIHVHGKLPVKLVALCTQADYTISYVEPTEGNAGGDLEITDPLPGNVDVQKVSVIVNQAIARHNAQVKAQINASMQSGDMTISDDEISDTAAQILKD